ncbi:hypothetical protein ElyMa_002346300 [Elysia marginata]|uniref:Uncharacterized protein n=1 Tax=Elysia marginata TaxID=1093978 RepID=A0AAV4G8Y2_9GAST|nr:hypothetical protein ElyMa_002346300 [Elysia marginata]
MIGPLDLGPGFFTGLAPSHGAITNISTGTWPIGYKSHRSIPQFPTPGETETLRCLCTLYETICHIHHIEVLNPVSPLCQGQATPVTAVLLIMTMKDSLTFSSYQHLFLCPCHLISFCLFDELSQHHEDVPEIPEALSTAETLYSLRSSSCRWLQTRRDLFQEEFFEGQEWDRVGGSEVKVEAAGDDGSVDPGVCASERDTEEGIGFEVEVEVVEDMDGFDDPGVGDTDRDEAEEAEAGNGC